MKNEVVLNMLGHDGIRLLKIKSAAPIDAARFERLIPLAAREKAIVTPSVDSMLGIHAVEIAYPIFEPFDVQYLSPKGFRRFMFVHYAYAQRVSAALELARDAFFAGTRYVPQYAYLARMPKGVDAGADVHGCFLFEAEWMPQNCVAVGGADV